MATSARKVEHAIKQILFKTHHAVIKLEEFFFFFNIVWFPRPFKIFTCHICDSIRGFKTSASKTLPGAHGARALGEVRGARVRGGRPPWPPPLLWQPPVRVEREPDDTTVSSCLRVKGQRGWVYLQVLMSLSTFDLLKPNQYATNICNLCGD